MKGRRESCRTRNWIIYMGKKLEHKKDGAWITTILLFEH